MSCAFNLSRYDNIIFWGLKAILVDSCYRFISLSYLIGHLGIEQ